MKNPSEFLSVRIDFCSKFQVGRMIRCRKESRLCTYVDVHSKFLQKLWEFDNSRIQKCHSSHLCSSHLCKSQLIIPPNNCFEEEIWKVSGLYQSSDNIQSMMHFFETFVWSAQYWNKFLWSASHCVSRNRKKYSSNRFWLMTNTVSRASEKHKSFFFLDISEISDWNESAY